MGGCCHCDKSFNIRAYEYHENNINNNNLLTIIDKRQDSIHGQITKISKNNGKNCYNEIIKNKNNIDEESKEELKKIVFNIKNDNINKNEIRNINFEENKSEKQLIKCIKKEHQSNINKNNKYRKRNTFNKISTIPTNIESEEIIKYHTSKRINKEIKKEIKTEDSRRNSNISKKKPEKFYLFDDNELLKDIKTINSSDEDNEKFILYYYRKSDDVKKNYYNKKDFYKKYKFISIYYQEKSFNFLFPINKYKNSDTLEDNIFKELQAPLCRKKFEKIFNISENKKIFIEKINNSDKKFNLIVKETKDQKNDLTNNKKISNIDNNIANKNNNENGYNINNNKILDNNKEKTSLGLKESNNNISQNLDEQKNQNKQINVIKNIISDKKDNNNINNLDKTENENPSDIKGNEKNILNNQINDNIININNNFNNTNEIYNTYFFPLIGLNNVGSTCFMNAILQFLIHIPELSSYFLNEYPKDKDILKLKNPNSLTKGDLSDAYYNVILGVEKKIKEETKYNFNSYTPKKFKEILGKYNSQFSKYEANDSKDLILYLLQTFHEELNYFGDKTAPTNILPPNQTLRGNAYNYFNLVYNTTDFSKISQLFYGTYENVITCLECKNDFYSYQKFEYISFSTFLYKDKQFNIMNGFENIESKQYLKGDNKYHCNICKKLVEAEIICKIIDLPKYLILNIDYGKNKVYNVKKLIFGHEIDLQKYISFYCGQKTKYKLVEICTHIGSSGPRGHYVAFCFDKNSKNWYKFDDSTCMKCDKNILNNNNPYLLLYEIVL